MTERKMFGGIAWMVFTGRAMRGFITVDAASIEGAAELGRWVDAGADFAESLPPKD